MSLMEWKSKKGYFGGLRGCNVSILGGQPLGLGSIVVNFFKGKDLFNFNFFSVDSDSTH